MAIAYERSTDTIHEAPTSDIEGIDRIGSGGSLAGGLVSGYLAADCREAVRLGVALLAIEQTVPGDLCRATREGVDRVSNLGEEELRIAR